MSVASKSSSISPVVIVFSLSFLTDSNRAVRLGGDDDYVGDDNDVDDDVSW